MIGKQGRIQGIQGFVDMWKQLKILQASMRKDAENADNLQKAKLQILNPFYQNINFGLTMKQTFFVGFLGSLSYASDWQPSFYKPSSYSYDKPIEIPKYPSVNVNALFPFSGTSAYSYQAASNQVIQQARGSLISQNRSFDSLFTQLPSTQQLDRLILNGDTYGILKAIRTATTNDSLTCDQRVAYLLEIQGRIRTAIQSKQFSADQLKVIIDGARAQIARLEKQISRLEGQIKNLWIPEIQAELTKTVAALEDLYRRFNAIEREVAPKETEVAGLKKQVRIITDATDAERNRINNDRLKLTEAQAQIRDLESRLAAAREQRANILGNIKRAQDLIDENDKKIADARDKIRAIEAEIKKLTQELDGLKGKYNDLEIEVERLRTEIAIAETKADGYRKDIAALQARIDAERKRLATPELDAINEMIASLKRMIPTVQGEIDRHYYYCYGAGAQEREAKGLVVYVVQGERFGDYLQEQYGTNIRAPIQGDVQLQRVNILGKTWVEKFGYPFQETALGGEGFDIAGSFNCLAPSKTVKGSGEIVSVAADRLGVKTADGKVFQFALGSCTRLESTSSLPTIGQNIAYIAVPSSAQGYNLYQASCY